MFEVNINADLGEMAGQDEAIMPYLSSCNIASGGHVGNSESIRKTILLAQQHDVKIGAHPSYPDSENFGRVRPNISDHQLRRSLKSQLRTFYEIAKKSKAEVNHIKPHGALYHDVVNNERIADLFLGILEDLQLKTTIYTLKNGFLHQKGRENHKILFEAFIDRNYNSDLSLVSRTDKNALIEKPSNVWNQLYKMAFLKKINVISGELIDINADTFCIHGDHPNALNILKYIQAELEKM
ncbi:LamB/YcsF family protein [Brumimicrobium mesophilum]|uniref:LamB/YcsF family protein n=1 Tax=Brumimicrobium mesophilum TaxID=392717 RepID=UPI000D144149|nr:LamB/YcsF family protein [Brumimicrobium mesophilum]